MNSSSNAVLIAGATSAIARALADRMAAAGAALYLAGRDLAEIERNARDLRVRHDADVAWRRFEATDYGAHEALVEDAARAMGRLDGVVWAVGMLGEQVRAEDDAAHTRRVIDVNLTGAASLLTHAANHLEAQERGFIAGLSSVAGDRGRASNYVYGAAKSGLTAFLSGLRNRLHETGVRVLTVKPGFVDTKMTFGKPGLFLVASPGRVADAMMSGLRRGRNEIYVPWFWRWVMTGIRFTPEEIFKRLNI